MLRGSFLVLAQMVSDPISRRDQLFPPSPFLHRNHIIVLQLTVSHRLSTSSGSSLSDVDVSGSNTQKIYGLVKSKTEQERQDFIFLFTFLVDVQYICQSVGGRDCLINIISGCVRQASVVKADNGVKCMLPRFLVQDGTGQREMRTNEN